MTLLPARDWLDSPATQKLIQAFRDAGIHMRFVGGCVRDTLLGRTVTDIDVATPAPPPRVMELLEEADIKAIPTGISHGTVTAVIGKRHFEITTLRKDVACDGRHADVRFTEDWKEDAARRDLTMNALYATIDGEVIDFFGGVEDATAGRIAFIGDPKQRITEDYLRILRFFRFHAHYSKSLPDAAGLAACGALASHLSSLSGERIQTEMMKLLSAPAPQATLAIMLEAHVLDVLLGFAPDLEPIHVLPRIEAETGVTPDPLRRLAALLRSSGKDAISHAQYVSHRWRFSNAMHSLLMTLVEPHDLPQSPQATREIKKLLRKLGQERFSDVVRLCWAERGMDIEESRPTYDPMLELASRWPLPVFPVTGSDLLQQGYASGPQLGATLKRLEALWEAEDYQPDKAALLAQARNLA